MKLSEITEASGDIKDMKEGGSMAYYYHVKVESTGSFRVKAESEEDARGLVLDHMHEAGTPFKPGVDILVLADGHDKVISISQQKAKGESRDD